MTVLERVHGRAPLPEHDGRSGARIEIGLLDGERVYVKTAAPGRDLASVLVGNDHIELDLFEAGFFDRLPAGVGSALVSVERTPDGIVTVSRDLGGTVLSWGGPCAGRRSS